jgi:release factor glutamine methyltransferase
VTLTQALIWLTEQLPAAEAKVEAERMLMHLLGVNRAYLRTWPEQVLTDVQHILLSKLLSRRQTGEPLAYLLGETDFYGLTLNVTPDVLIPRADTECLVDAALTHTLAAETSQVLDLGTGSGAIAIAIAHHRPLAQVTAIDSSLAALRVAQDNICRHRLNIRTLHSHWFNSLNIQRFDVIVSNPPYIAQNDPHLAQTSLPWEPKQALTSGLDGLDDIRFIVQEAPKWLQHQGWLVLEHGYDQGNAVRDLLNQQGFQHIQTLQDFGQQDRVTQGQYHAF